MHISCVQEEVTFTFPGSIPTTRALYTLLVKSTTPGFPGLMDDRIGKLLLLVRCSARLYLEFSDDNDDDDNDLDDDTF